MASVNSKRIVKNTMMLYFRTLLTMGVSLFTVRVVLNTLGVEDYGLYNVVGGIVALLAFLPVSMASATQRFFSFALGEGDYDKLRRIFTVNWVIYCTLGVLALIILETLGAWFVSDVVKIPADRYSAVRTLYSISVWTFVVSVVSSPFQAIITAHEDMHLFSIVAIFEAILKLGVVLLLPIIPGDKLVIYGGLMLGAMFVVAAAYASICLRHYEECQFRRLYWDQEMVRGVIGFTWWTLFGQLTTAIRIQAVTILMNQVFNPAVVAARAIAMNVATQSNLFATNFNTSVYPPIIKSYASGNRDEMGALVFGGSKVTFFLLWILALPFLLQTKFILELWLRTPPPEAVLFTRLALIDALIVAVCLPLMTAARAPGRMKAYELTLGSMQLAVFVICWAVFRFGGAPWSVFAVSIGASTVMLGLRLFFVKRLTGLPIGTFFRKVLLPIAVVVSLSLVLSWSVTRLLPDSVIFRFFSMAISSVSVLIAGYSFGLDPEWRRKLSEMLARKIGFA